MLLAPCSESAGLSSSASPNHLAQFRSSPLSSSDMRLSFTNHPYHFFQQPLEERSTSPSQCGMISRPSKSPGFFNSESGESVGPKLSVKSNELLSIPSSTEECTQSPLTSARLPVNQLATPLSDWGLDSPLDFARTPEHLVTPDFSSLNLGQPFPMSFPPTAQLGGQHRHHFTATKGLKSEAGVTGTRRGNSLHTSFLPEFPSVSFTEDRTPGAAGEVVEQRRGRLSAPKTKRRAATLESTLPPSLSGRVKLSPKDREALASFDQPRGLESPSRTAKAGTPDSTISVTPGGYARKYACTWEGCGKAFTTSGHLVRHKRIHTGEKRYECVMENCTSRFSRQDNMLQHYRTHLSGKSRRIPSVSSVNSSNETSSKLAARPNANFLAGDTKEPNGLGLNEHSYGSSNESVCSSVDGKSHHEPTGASPMNTQTLDASNSFNHSQYDSSPLIYASCPTYPSRALVDQATFYGLGAYQPLQANHFDVEQYVEPENHTFAPPPWPFQVNVLEPEAFSHQIAPAQYLQDNFETSFGLLPAFSLPGGQLQSYSNFDESIEAENQMH